MYEAKKSFAIVLTMSRCHFDEMVTGHRNEVLTSFCQSLLFSSTAHLTITFETLIQGMKLAVNSKKETNSRVKMGQGSRWASVIYPLKESKWGRGHYGLLLFTPWQNETSSEQQERNKQQGQNGQRVKMGFCYLPPEKVKMGLLLFTPWQSQTNSEQQERNKQQGQNGQRVKMGQGSRSASVLYPLTESN